MEFCKQFNDRTKTFKKGIPIPTAVEIKQDRTFQFKTGMPPNSYFLMKAAGIKKGAGAPGVCVRMCAYLCMCACAYVRMCVSAFSLFLTPVHSRVRCACMNSYSTKAKKLQVQ